MGNIYEGNFISKKSKMEICGFCVTWVGHQNEIHIGWYNDSVREGNWMCLKADDLSKIESGFYEEGQRKGKMKDHYLYKNFKVN